jgi:3-oxoacyl-[acyl-carrier-protein] synthase-3
MDGTAVFNFVQHEVPPMIEDVLAFAGCSRESIDYYLFHQPNKFMLQKLANAIKVPLERVPSNIVEHFGNASGVTVPTNIAFNLGAKLLDTAYQVCLAGFGVGLTWSSMILKLGDLDFCRMIDY